MSVEVAASKLVSTQIQAKVELNSFYAMSLLQYLRTYAVPIKMTTVKRVFFSQGPILMVWFVEMQRVFHTIYVARIELGYTVLLNTACRVTSKKTFLTNLIAEHLHDYWNNFCDNADVETAIVTFRKDPDTT